MTTLEAFARYHGVPMQDAAPSPAPSVMSSGAAWERQALLRARAAAGDSELGARVIEVAHVAAYERGAPPAEEMHHLRLRMQHELTSERDTRRDLKMGRGGLLDVEFATQWLQMRHGHNAEVRTTDTGAALTALVREGYLEEKHYKVLRDGYLFLRRLEQRIVVRTGSGTSVIDRRQPGLPELAARLGFRSTARGSAADNLWAEYERVTAGVRASYLAVLNLAE